MTKQYGLQGNMASMNQVSRILENAQSKLEKARVGNNQLSYSETLMHKHDLLSCQTSSNQKVEKNSFDSKKESLKKVVSTIEWLKSFGAWCLTFSSVIIAIVSIAFPITALPLSVVLILFTLSALSYFMFLSFRKEKLKKYIESKPPEKDILNWRFISKESFDILLDNKSSDFDYEYYSLHKKDKELSKLFEFYDNTEEIQIIKELFSEYCILVLLESNLRSKRNPGELKDCVATIEKLEKLQNLDNIHSSYTLNSKEKIEFSKLKVSLLTKIELDYQSVYQRRELLHEYFDTVKFLCENKNSSALEALRVIRKDLNITPKTEINLTY